MTFMISSAVLDKLKPEIHKVIEVIEEAIEKKQPILIRHHNDADGYTAGIAIERAVLPLISKVHRRERDAAYYYQRLPSMTPYYNIEDALRDTQFFLRNAEQFEMKAPLILLLDFGSGAESIHAAQFVKVYGATVIVIDHHPTDSHLHSVVHHHINPHLVGSTYDYSAGMLCAEIGNCIWKEQHEKEGKEKPHFAFIAAVSGTADKVASEEYKEYCVKAQHAGFSKEMIKKVASALDYTAHILGPSPGRDVVQDLLGRDPKKQEKLLQIIEKKLEKVFQEQLAACLHYAIVEEKKNFLFVTIPIEEMLHRGSFPPRGKTIGLVSDHFKEKGKKAVVVGVGKSGFNFRCNPEISWFDVNQFIERCRKKLPHALVNGGGHRVAGSVTFIPAAFVEMEKELREYMELRQ